ncbi:MAG: glycosyltransferase family 2 protein [Thermoanaerobaculia bacterium]
MNRTVAVVIPTHNRMELLARALRSVRSQSLAPSEVIVVDDGSEDGTAAMVAEEFPEVKLLSQPQSGVSAARNRGIATAESDWLAFLDSDDEWLPNKLEVQMDALGRERRMRLCHCEEIWVRDGRRVNPSRRHAKSGGRIFRNCLPLCAISPSAAIVHRSAFEDIGGFDESLPACEDYDFWLRFTASNPVLFVGRALLIKHGGHRDQLSRATKALDRYRIRALVKLLEDTELEPGDRRAAIETLLGKIDVYRAGVLKRGRVQEAATLDELAARYGGVLREAAAQ